MLQYVITHTQYNVSKATEEEGSGLERLYSVCSEILKQWKKFKAIVVISRYIIMELEFSRHIFEESSNIIKIYYLGAELFHAGEGRTDRHDEANSHFSQFCKRA